MAYQTPVAYNVTLPASVPEVDILVGGFAFEALRPMSIWRRLVAADAPGFSCLEAIILREPLASDRQLLETIVPPSQLASTILIADPDGVWDDLIQPAHVASCFAAVIRDGTGAVVMKDLPTEEAWDAFLTVLTSAV